MGWKPCPLQNPVGICTTTRIKRYNVAKNILAEKNMSRRVDVDLLEGESMKMRLSHQEPSSPLAAARLLSPSAAFSATATTALDKLLLGHYDLCLLVTSHRKRHLREQYFQHFFNRTQSYTGTADKCGYRGNGESSWKVSIYIATAERRKREPECVCLTLANRLPRKKLEGRAGWLKGAREGREAALYVSEAGTAA